MIKAKIQKVKISQVTENSKNPRVINKHKFKKLVASVKGFPEMLALRPIVVDQDNVILGGNMRYKACKEIGLKEVYIIKADDLTEKQAEEFIIKDNVGFGEWDWDILANAFDNVELKEWGLDVWQPEEELDKDSEYVPEYSPSTDGKQLSAEEYEKRKELLNSKEYHTDKNFIPCICPNCFHEFNVEKP